MSATSTVRLFVRTGVGVSTEVHRSPEQSSLSGMLDDWPHHVDS